jgi:hypothetical protein
VLLLVVTLLPVTGVLIARRAADGAAARTG